LSRQNIYDNEAFFNSYKNLRGNAFNANNLVEKPALFSLIPDLTGKNVLDLGCGYGENCHEFIKRGAQRVVGIDISQKMLEIAGSENHDDRITFLHLCMEDISEINEMFDLVISSLAFHYVEDFDALLKAIRALLNPKGVLIWSQENPINTCFTTGNRWTTDEGGNRIFVNLSNYSIVGQRKSRWFIDDVIKYHRTFSSIVNSLISSGFSVDEMLEPIPDPEMMRKCPFLADNVHKPDFLLVKAHK
jgi:SAM-dependent methyltransferase